MKNLRRWELENNIAQTLVITADARLSTTHYLDDQVWSLRLGQGDAPALAFQTKYGNRVNLASIVPMWVHGNHVIYQAQTYHEKPRVVAFAPNAIFIEAAILPGLDLQAVFWVIESQVAGAQFTLHNTQKKTIDLNLELYAHLIAQSREQSSRVVQHSKQTTVALAFDDVPAIKPAILLENAQPIEGYATPRIGTALKLKANKQYVIRFVHAGFEQVQTSLSRANQWLQVDWKPFLSSINQANEAIPQIQTGNLQLDAMLGLSLNRLMQAVLKPEGIFPRQMLISQRTPETGFSPRETGNDHLRTWTGQDSYLAYLSLPVLATIDPVSAEGILRNFIAVQQSDGSIDLRPGASGQKIGLLCPPILAQTAWNIAQLTGRSEFLQENFIGLVKFFNRWFEADHDADEDQAPEWQDDRQTGYVAFPTFSPARQWAQGADIRTVETPDLTAYLVAEARALENIARQLGEERGLKSLTNVITTLTQTLETFWQDGRYQYRDRDTHQTQTGQLLLSEAPGDVPHSIRVSMTEPARLVVSITGGVSHVPRITVLLNGLDRDGKVLNETLTTDDFLWQNRRGCVTTRQVYSQVDQIKVEGLSRVYKIDVKTLDTREYDINALMPLISGVLTPQRQAQLIEQALDRTHFWRTNGITMISAQSEFFDPANAEGAGGIWFYWLTRIGETMLTAKPDQVGNLLKSTFDLLQDVLTQQGKFGQFYHADEPIALGEADHLAGIAPLYLFWRALGISIPSATEVWVGGEFAWGRAITVRQHGIYVRRTNKEIKIKFASGHVVQLPADAEWQKLTDPKAKKRKDSEIQPIAITYKDTPAPPPVIKRNRIIIEVESED